MTEHKLNTEQRAALTTIVENRNNLIIGPRQCGLTSLFVSRAMAQCMTEPETTFVIITSKEAIINSLHHMVEETLYDLPYGQVKKMFVRRNKDYLEFANGSRLKFLCPYNVREKLVGWSVNEYIIDNASYIDNLDEVHRAILPTVLAVRGKITFGTTVEPGFQQNSVFRDLWRKSADGLTNFKLTSLS